jgi:hypothetical protein
VRTVFTAFDLLYGGAEIVYVGSIDAGDTFPDAQLISEIDNFNSYAPEIAAGWGLALAWSDVDVWTGHTAIRVRVSADGGQTFSTAKRVDTSFGYACCPSIALAGDDAIFVTWQEKIDPFVLGDEAYEVLFSRSLDGGATFSAPVNLSDYPQPSSPAQIVTDEAGNVYVLWVEGDYLVDMKLFLVVSHDAGATFSEPLLLEGPTAEVHGSLAASGDGAIWATWIARDGIGNYDSRIARSLDAGESFSQPASLPGDCGLDGSCRYAIASRAADESFIAESPAGASGDVLVRRGRVVVCGDANGDGQIGATDALVVLAAAVGSGSCEPARCDVDESGGVTASDALAILRVAVGIPVVLSCPK